jgi:hypothetical protein
MPVPQIITVHNLTPNSIFISDLDQDFEIHPGQTVTATNYDTPDTIQASNELESAYRNGLVEVSLNGVAITAWPFLVSPGGGVDSFNTRTGAVTMVSGDLTPFFVDNETPSGTGPDGVNDTFTLAFTPVVGSEHLYKNGIRQKPGAGEEPNDYTIVGNVIIFDVLNIPQPGDSLLADYRK